MPESKRKIIHIDMDAFYASVEQRDFPELRGNPVAVGGGSERGVVCTASYEARKFGVRSAMAGGKARALCPDLIFVKPRFDAYKKVSAIIREIFYSYTDLVEPLSLDEAYLDVTENKFNIKYATQVAKEIRQKIFEQTGLTASAGVSYNKFLAKSASDIHKPNGMKVILPEDAQGFLESLKIGKFHGIGKVTETKMNDHNIYTGADLKRVSQYALNQKFGKSGLYYYNIVRGIDERAVDPDQVRKSISVENTLSKNIMQPNLIEAEIENIADELYKRCKKSNTKGYTVVLKIKFSDFKIISRRITVEYPVFEKENIKELAIYLLEKVTLTNPVRLVGVGISNLIEQDAVNEGQEQLSLVL